MKQAALRHDASGKLPGSSAAHLGERSVAPNIPGRSTQMSIS